MKATDLCPAPHLEAADLEGKEQTLTIASVGFADVGSEKERKGVVYFEEVSRGLVLNRTNLKRIIALHGADTDHWIGKAVTLYPSETDFGGKTVDCLRIREK